VGTLSKTQSRLLTTRRYLLFNTTTSCSACYIRVQCNYLIATPLAIVVQISAQLADVSQNWSPKSRKTQ